MNLIFVSLSLVLLIALWPVFPMYCGNNLYSRMHLGLSHPTTYCNAILEAEIFTAFQSCLNQMDYTSAARSYGERPQNGVCL